MDARTARMCLASIFEPGRPEVAQAIADYGPEEVFAGLRASGDSPLANRARKLDPDLILAGAKSAGMRFLVPGDPQWPPRLGDLAGCDPVRQLRGEPLGLWVAGNGDLAQLASCSVAMVGSRASTPYGDGVAADLAAELSESGRSVISGGAYGIDSAAHRGSLAGRTPGVAVLAGGLDRPYPAGNRALLQRIAEHGVLVSELGPGEHPTRVRFLARNRLIAALGCGTVLVEAAVRSGARNTVSWATALARPVMAVPGPVTSATSVTPHWLIREAEAVLVADAAQVLEILAPSGCQLLTHPTGESRTTDALAPDEMAVYEAVPGRGNTSVAELSARTGLSIAACLAVLGALDGRGLLVQDEAGGWRLSRRSRS